MNKAYSIIGYENFPSTKTPIDEINLGKMETGINTIDDRVVQMDTEKATKTEVATTIVNLEFNEKTGIITATRKNGTKIMIDTLLEKIAINFGYDPKTQKITITLEDGTIKEIDLSALITQYEFVDTATVSFLVGTDGKISAIIPNGSITEEKLDTNYLAQIKVQVASATASATSATASQNAAKTSETNAKTSETNAKTSETNAKTYETNAKNYATASSNSAKASSNSATTSQNYAVGDTNSAKYYYEQCQNISEGLKGGLLPMGTVTFANLPKLSTINAGYMYNVSDEFTTTSDFKEGAGYVIPMGSNVYKTTDGKWDVMAGTPVSGVKGNAETTYRRGNVNITPANIGALATNGNSKDVTTSFTSADSTTVNSWTDVTALASGEKHSSILNKISTMFKNVRYLYKMLGSTDISKIGDGTVTGGISTLNASLKTKTYTLEQMLNKNSTCTLSSFHCIKTGNHVHIDFVLKVSSAVTGYTSFPIFTVPKELVPTNRQFGTVVAQGKGTSSICDIYSSTGVLTAHNWGTNAFVDAKNGQVVIIDYII